jgi:hypothetical protein
MIGSLLIVSTMFILLTSMFFYEGEGGGRGEREERERRGRGRREGRGEKRGSYR